ncbi:ATP-dependent DNA ligase [Streptomyces virginiae]
MTLCPPVEPMLAQAAEAVPGPAALRAGVAYEQKPDGHRALLFTASGRGGTVVVQTRRGALVQDRWPDLVAAAEAQLPHGLVLDGELVVWDIEAGRLSFEALQRRAATRARGALSLAVKWPAYLSPLTSCSTTARSCSPARTSSAVPCWRTCSPSTH